MKATRTRIDRVTYVRLEDAEDCVENDNRRQGRFKPEQVEVKEYELHRADGMKVDRYVTLSGSLYRKDGSVGLNAADARWFSGARAESSDRWGGSRPISEMPAWLAEIVDREAGPLA
jgi:hypothetical protein